MSIDFATLLRKVYLRFVVDEKPIRGILLIKSLDANVSFLFEE